MSSIKINYCIGTYEGVSTNKKYELFPKCNELHKHMVRLAELVPSLKTPISQITIVKPKCTGKKIENYYRIEEWQNLIPEIKIVVIDFDYPELYSYGQWIHAYKNFPDFDYYIMTEDDYCFDHVDFTSILLDLFRKKVPNNVGYISSFTTDKLHGLDWHAAIPTGMLSREAMERQDLNILKNYIHNGGALQYVFSKILVNRSVKLVDTSSEYRALYWSDGIGEDGKYYSRLENYSSDKNVVDNLIVPTQILPGIIVKNKYYSRI